MHDVNSLPVIAVESKNTFYPCSRHEWREWLACNYRREHEVWLVTFRKSAGSQSIAYNDAVEEALCFGWIDSIRKSLDDNRLAQRFTPRHSGSKFSQTNKERIARLKSQGLVANDVLVDVRDVDPCDFLIPNDILDALKVSEEAWTFFRTTSDSYQRIRAAYVESARHKPDEFQKRLQHLIRKSERRKQFGYGIETYY